MGRLAVRLGSAVSAVVCAVAGVAAVAQGAAAATAAPVTIPALQRWTPGTGAFTFGMDSRVVARTGDQRQAAAVLAADLRALTGVPISSWVGVQIRPGDIELRIGPAEGGSEGYRVVVGASLVVQGGTHAGVFNGTRTVLQWLRQGWTVPAGTAADWPVYPERGLLVDVGRQFFSVEWLRARIRELSYLKLNLLHLHLSDRFGFRLAGETHPEIVSPQHYTKREIADLIAYAASYGVRIMPEIDFPGHADAILVSHPELKLVSRTGVVDHGAIDLSKPAAYDLIADVMGEFLPLFPDPQWHVGADEYVTNYDDYPQLAAYAKVHYGANATGKDTYYGFINWANGIVRAAGKTARIANDGLKPGGATIAVDSDIIVDHWSQNGFAGFPWSGDAYTGKQLIAAGHRVVNASFTPTYYTTGGPAAMFNAPPSAMYDLWHPDVFVDGSRLDSTERAANLGSKVSLWCDDPNAATEAELATVLHPRLRVLAQLTWGSPKPLLYSAFLPVMHTVGAAPA
ncbi:beta-N-acetylhexosaminidase [Actinokineospora sp.]|uniref:beta-N-acetylhexosaminidase n=1 Tax=Actinokineospora sp. TaxID=1872133 RepID=UPI003D6B14D7